MKAKTKQLIASILKKKHESGKMPAGKSKEAVQARKQALAIAYSEARRKKSS